MNFLTLRRTAENGFATGNGVSKSAKVVLEQIPVTFEHSPHAESSSCILVR